MSQEYITLFNYKGKDILIKKVKEHFIVGIRGETGIDIWLENVRYNNFRLARTSGREYARIIIDKILVSRKEETKVCQEKQKTL
jgi:hypothetical protein